MVRQGVRRGTAAALAAGLLALGACGGDDDGGEDAPSPGEEVGVAQPFPDPAAGSSLADLRRGLGPGPLMATSVSVLEPGRNRFAFALFDRTRRQIGATPAAVYVAPAGGVGPVTGPHRARYQSLEVSEQHRSDTVERDGDAARSIYVAEVPFAGEGEYEVLGVTQLDQRVVGGTPVKVRVGRSRRPPAVGQPVPRVHTPTADEAGSLAEIDTREPPSTMHEDDLADVLGRRPVMLLFATPRLCRSRVCGPVVDVLEQVKAEHPDDAAYIHMEIWNGNDRDQGQRPQVRAFGLPSEPWLFAIDARGRVAARIEGAFSVAEAKAALRKAAGR